MPDTAVQKALREIDFAGRRVHLVAIGKAAWQMAYAAWSLMGSEIADGIVITKYDHSKGAIGELRIFEAGHPVPDGNTYLATGEVVRAAEGWGEEDAVLFLISGGGSALFEKPLVPEAELQDITSQMLACGGQYKGQQIIGRKTIDLMRQNHLNADQMKDFTNSYLDGYGYGLGVRTLVDPGRVSNSSVGEFGWTGAMAT